MKIITNYNEPNINILASMLYRRLEEFQCEIEDVLEKSGCSMDNINCSYDQMFEILEKIQKLCKID